MVDILRDSKGRFLKGQPSLRKGIKLNEYTLKKLRINGNWFQKGQTPWMKGKSHTLKSNEKNRLSHLGKKMPPRSESFKTKLRIANLGKTHSKETKKKISISKKGRKHTIVEIEKYKKWRATQKIPYKDTKPERMMQIALALNGIKFEKHKPFKLRCSWHQVDIFIQPNICVEIDGIHWHLKEKDFKRDLWQTQELILMGYHVIRIRDKDIIQNAQKCSENIFLLIKQIQNIDPLNLKYK